MTDRESFELAICLEPADDTPRLVFADWLGGRGEAELASFVRLQVGDTQCCIDLGPGMALYLTDHRTEIYRFPKGVSGIFRRGFVDEIRCDLATLLGGPRYTFDPSSGEDRVTSRAPGIAAELFRKHPITKVVLTDVTPRESTTGWWFASPRAAVIEPERGYVIPEELFRALQDGVVDGKKSYFILSRSHPTADAANLALSVAVVAVCRGLAGLPEPKT